MEGTAGPKGDQGKSEKDGEPGPKRTNFKEDLA